MALYVRGTYVDHDQNALFGEDPDYTRAFTDNRGKLFRALQQEYGRCVSKMYCDTKDGSIIEVGYVFHKRKEYQDFHRDYRNTKPETYLQESWIEIEEREEE